MGRRSKNAAMVVANTAAMQAAVALSDHVNVDAIRVMHRALMAGDSRHRQASSRTEPVWIGGGSTPIGADVRRPRHELIVGAIDDLIAFAQRGRCARAAADRGESRTVRDHHPFTDGNGPYRTRTRSSDAAQQGSDRQ